jgi:hypothetical protein
MNPKPTRTFLILATVMLVIFGVGLLALIVLALNSDVRAAATRDNMLSANATTLAQAQVMPTITVSEVTVSPCFFNWARQDLPDVTAAAQTALEAANMRAVSVRAEAYGEDCIDPATNKARYFAAMTTDFYLTAKMGDVTDEATMGDMARAAYEALMTLPADDLPARLGYLDIMFKASDQEMRLRIMFEQAAAPINEGLAGAALFTALEGLQ